MLLLRRPLAQFHRRSEAARRTWGDGGHATRLSERDFALPQMRSRTG